jgi:signal transduction histidine kinase
VARWRNLLDRPTFVDALLAVGVATASLPMLVLLANGQLIVDDSLGDPVDITARTVWASAGVAALQALPLVWRRRAPWVVLIATLAMWTLPVVLADVDDAVFYVDVLPIVVAAFTVASTGTVRRAVAAGVVAVVGSTSPTIVINARSVSGLGTADLLASMLPSLVLPVAFAIGAARAVHSQRARADRLQRAAIDAEIAAEIAAETAAVRAATEERRRLARELHDVVAHHVNLIVVQAEAAPFATGEGDAPHRFGTIADTGRAALDELDRLLGLLRGDESASRSPLPSATEIPSLVAATRDAGIPVELEHFELPTTLDPTTSATLHRVVQEGLTNVVKHGDRADPARVAVTTSGDGVEVSISNRSLTGDRAHSELGTAGRQGFGLRTMAERVHALGGTLVADDAEHGRFRIVATLPVERRGERT